MEWEEKNQMVNKQVSQSCTEHLRMAPKHRWATHSCKHGGEYGRRECQEKMQEMACLLRCTIQLYLIFISHVFANPEVPSGLPLPLCIHKLLNYWHSPYYLPCFQVRVACQRIALVLCLNVLHMIVKLANNMFSHILQWINLMVFHY